MSPSHPLRRLRRLSARSVLLAALLAAAVSLIGAPAASADGGGFACTHYGDKRPKTLGKKQARSAVICLINKARRNNGRGGLGHSSKLTEAARKHSGAMARKGCFSHQCSGEKDLEGRLRAVGYLHGGLSRWAYGENIAKGSGSRGTPRKIVRGWMRSSGHRANIMSGTFKDIGVGFHNKGHTGFYTADFGMRSG